MQTKRARYTKKVVTLAHKAVIGEPRTAAQKGDGGYTDWVVVVSMHGLKTHLDLPYRRLLDVLHEMPRIGRILDVKCLSFPTVQPYACACRT